MPSRPKPMLAAAVYDRAAHRRVDAEWLAAEWETSRVLIVTPKSATAVAPGPDGTPRVQFRDPGSTPAGAPRRFLGLVEGVAFFSATAEPEDGAWATLREVGPTMDEIDAGLFVSAIALEQWHQRHTHCPLCGSPTEEAKSGWTRVCPRDGSEHFPRTDPAIITVVHDGAERCLLGRSVGWPPRRYSTLAGFVEPGESLEAAVVREIREEVSVDVVDVRYVASQPWPFPSSLMLGFSARAEGDQIVRPDHVEIAEADWFTRDQVQQAADWTDGKAAIDPTAVLQAISPPLSISRYLIDLWLGGELS